jgi:hypothetical protein
MKVAFHFTCSDIEYLYDRHFCRIAFSNYLNLNQSLISSKILIGDLGTYSLLSKIDNPSFFFSQLLRDDNWKRIISSKLNLLVEENVFVICFETIQKNIAEKLHQSLINDPNYIGAFEIDNSVELQWWLYGECIGPKYRILNQDIYILIDDREPETLEYAEDEKAFLDDLFFDNVKLEISNYRYSVFDDNHHYKNAKRAHEWRESIDSLFSTITDEITAKLIDTAPELTDRLWAITNAFGNAETGEQYAQAMMSCRRVFEYVTDCLFPPTNEESDGHSLKKDKYKNRLFEFAKKEFRSNSNIELITTSIVSMTNEWNKLYELSNKGVHDSTHRQECRRCIIRTILLLDDLISLKGTPFDVRIQSDNFENKARENFK